MLSVTGDERGLQDHGELKGSDEVKEYCVFGTVDSKNAIPEAKSSGIVLGGGHGIGARSVRDMSLRDLFSVGRR